MSGQSQRVKDLDALVKLTGIYRGISKGDIVLYKGKHRLVVVCWRCGIAFEKIGYSWTDPNPVAWHDRAAIDQCQVVQPATAETRLAADRLLVASRSRKPTSA